MKVEKINSSLSVNTYNLALCFEPFQYFFFFFLQVLKFWPDHSSEYPLRQLERAQNLLSLKVKSERRRCSIRSRNFTDFCTCGGGHELASHQTGVCKFDEFTELYIFVSFQQIAFKLGNVSDFKAFFFSLVDGFVVTGPSQ